MALTDGAAHAVDSSELAFKLACQYAFRDAYNKASPTVLEPIMAVEVSCCNNRNCCTFQGAVLSRALLAWQADQNSCYVQMHGGTSFIHSLKHMLGRLSRPS